MKATIQQYVELEHEDGSKEAFPIEVARNLLEVLEGTLLCCEVQTDPLLASGAVTGRPSPSIDLTVFGHPRTIPVETAKQIKRELCRAIK